DIVDELIDQQAELKECGISGNYTKPENLHLTLAFIGEYGNSDEVIDVIDSVPFRPIPIKFNGLELFRDMYFARIADNPGLNSYVRRLRRALAQNNIPFDKKKFRPHITLLRRATFRGNDAPKEIKISETMATKISLMRSERGKNGMIYTELN
ncbi:MAG: RNA 2',3'-cyclic phosphodiesterase, partial [Lachnospiraceae bacterium]|nr:RNA 2',3'-cyclic phosphodiesterase [Lachnospiraceae bacterium]